ncbi:hypothetical protein NDU88_000791 [Pleurodeles waltl]|uniref:Uncharacterized protein n=1 Tax=Pleurodeles waltl TaxID=8319 RepID=A0AAV7TFZ2_PLEWA|nr:hypothetical protein NDU88_000791 [Pleurodeles waltl]
MIAGSFGAAAVFSGQSAARLLEGRCAARCAAKGAMHRLARLAAARATLGQPLPCLLFTSCCTFTGGAALCGWLLMAPKAIKTPLTLRGKPSLEATAVRREKKQLAPTLKARTGAQGKGAQQDSVQDDVALLVKKWELRAERACEDSARELSYLCLSRKQKYSLSYDENQFQHLIGLLRLMQKLRQT